MSNAQKTLNIGMLGCGVVGSSVARLLQEDSGDFAARSGAHLSLTKVAVKNLSTKRDHVSTALLTDDAASVVNDPSIDIVIEVMGGIEPARADGGRAGCGLVRAASCPRLCIEGTWAASRTAGFLLRLSRLHPGQARL